MKISREKARSLGFETVKILNVGYYVTNAGTRVDIQAHVDSSIRGTVSYPPERDLPDHTSHDFKMTVDVRNQTTLGAVADMKELGFNPAALNFASATSPGGGFLSGARAQEEYLARSSSLWLCLRNNPMYAYHQGRKNPFYSDYVIYSPNVLILRSDDGQLLERPYTCSIITSPAVHAKAVHRYMLERVEEIPDVMWNRILKVLAVTEHHGHKGIVLGAWGCGAFGNDGKVIAGLFRKALAHNFSGAFEKVVFAITDWSEEKRFIGPFFDAFGN